MATLHHVTVLLRFLLNELKEFSHRTIGDGNILNNIKKYIERMKPDITSYIKAQIFRWLGLYKVDYLLNQI